LEQRFSRRLSGRPCQRVYLEPNAQFDEPIQYDKSGLELVSFGEGYKEFKVRAIAENSPASEASLLPGDLLVKVNGSPASAFSLSDIRQILKQANECDLTVRRGNETRSVKLKLRPRV
jgi:C-terminal processing protease CtpA/Prc